MRNDASSTGSSGKLGGAIGIFHRVSYCANDNHLHLIIFSGKMQYAHILSMAIPHQPARSYLRSRMVELAVIYFLTAWLAFLLFLCFCELGYLLVLAVLLRTHELHVTNFSFLWVELIEGNSAAWRVWQTLGSTHHQLRYIALSKLTNSAARAYPLFTTKKTWSGLASWKRRRMAVMCKHCGFFCA